MSECHRNSKAVEQVIHGYPLDNPKSRKLSKGSGFQMHWHSESIAGIATRNQKCASAPPACMELDLKAMNFKSIMTRMIMIDAA